jgi:hypothetical protein
MASFTTGRIVYSVRYTLESRPPTIMELVVPLDRDENAIGPTKPADESKRRSGWSTRSRATRGSTGKTYRVQAIEVDRPPAVD